MSLYLGHTSLMMAAESGNTDTVRIILEHGADVNAKDVYGKLHILSQYLYIHKPEIFRAKALKK